ncbi:hypothetical protein [Mycolicibacterium brisbanense]
MNAVSVNRTVTGNTPRRVLPIRSATVALLASATTYTARRGRTMLPERISPDRQVCTSASGNAVLIAAAVMPSGYVPISSTTRLANEVGW